MRISVLRAPQLAVVAMAILLAVGLTACGGSGDSGNGSSSSEETSTNESGSGGEGGSSSPGVVAAQEVVDQYRKENNTFTPPGPSVDASSLQGKAVWYIPISASIPVIGVEEQGAREAASALGMTFKTCDGKFQPAAMSACIQEAVNSKPAGIVLDGIDPTLVEPAMEVADSAGIPVMVFAATGEESEILRFLYGDDPKSQEIAMNWIIADSNGEANILAATITGQVQTEQTAEASTKVMEENCPGCQYEAVAVSTNQINSVPSGVSSALLKNPDANYGLPEFDFVAPLFERGVQQAGRTNDMSMVSINAAFSQVQEVADGGFQKADVGANRNYLGWETMDGLVRMALGEPAAEKVTIPVRIFDETNVGELEMTEAASSGGAWYGSTSYKQEFPKLWGAG